MLNFSEQRKAPIWLGLASFFVIWCVSCAGPEERLGWLGLALALGAGALAAAPGPKPRRMLAALACGALVVGTGWLPALWPLAQIVMVLPATLLWLREARHPPLTRGRVEWLPVLVPALTAAVALPLWFALDPSADPGRYPFPDLPAALLLVGALVFATVNAALEELCFRAFMQGALDELTTSAIAIVIQGVAFGVAHWFGFPSGWWGVLLAGSWGVALGFVRWRCEGLLAPWIAHVFADLTIFAVLWAAQG